MEVHMVRRITLALVALSSTAVAQPAPTAATLCRQAGQVEQNRLVKIDRDAGRAPDATAIVAASRKVTRDCLDKIDMTSASARDRSDIATAYISAGDTAKAERLIDAMLKTKASESEHADAIVAGIRLAIAKWDPFAGANPEGEKLARELDAMSDAVISQKITAHSALLGRYDYADLDDPLHDQATKLLAVSKRALELNALPMTKEVPARGDRAAVPAVNSAYLSMMQAYGSLARAAGDYLHADSAIMILDEADRVVGSVYWPAKESFARDRTMYALVGTRATPIEGKWWVNAPDGTTKTLGNGKVSVLQFTATWCVPCKKSYPPMLRLMKKYDGKAVESVMATSLYGFLGDQRNLTPEQEVAADREYYAKEHELPFPVSINPSQAGNQQDPQELRYAVGGIPEIVIIDRKGVIRATVVGWDKGNEARFASLIDKLLAEK
jgi:thiol-disulfide isomerase/thioredoxin